MCVVADHAMVISTNLISTTGGRKVGESLMSNIYRPRSGINNQASSKISTIISRAYRGVFGNNILIEYYSKNITFMTHFGGSQLTS